MSDYNTTLFYVIFGMIAISGLNFAIFQNATFDTKYSIKATVLTNTILFVIIFIGVKPKLEFCKIKEMSIVEIENYDSQKLEKYRKFLIKDENYKVKEKYVIKKKIDKYIKDHNLKINEIKYKESLDINSLILEDKVIKFKATVKEILLAPLNVEEIK